VSGLLEALREVGAHEQARLLVNRLPAEGHFDLSNKLGKNCCIGSAASPMEARPDQGTGAT
jgi:hypothetical protein